MADTKISDLPEGIRIINFSLKEEDKKKLGVIITPEEDET